MWGDAIKRLVWPILILALLLIPGWGIIGRWDQQAADTLERVMKWGLGTGVGFALAWLVVRLVEVFVWTLLEKRLSAPVPRLLKDLVAGVIFLMAAMTIAGLVFGQSVAGAWATSGVMGIVVGFALRNMIADVFSGIALNIDQPFKIGEWIELHPRSVEPMRGRVVEISWRSTRIQKNDNTIIAVPNSMISSIVMVNLSRPEPKSRFDHSFCLEFGIPAERALRVLSAGVCAAKGVLKDPKPKAMVDSVTSNGVEYKVRYWLDPIQTSPRKGRHAVTRSVLEHMHHAGLSLAYPKQDLYLARMPHRQLDRQHDREAILERVELFGSFQQEEFRLLSEHVTEHTYKAGASVVVKGQPGSSMFLVVEGLLDVCTESEIDGQMVHVSDIGPGDYFGEMCLLTGAERSATVMAATDTVLFEIDKPAMEEILARRPDVAKSLAETAASRKKHLMEAGRLPREETEESQESVTDYILKRMGRVFKSLKNVFLI